MTAIGHSGTLARGVEIKAALAGRRFGLCGFDPAEVERISKVLGGAGCLALPLDEILIAESAHVYDGLLIKLSGLGQDGLRAAATSCAPILVAGSSVAFLEGAYGWPGDLLSEPWSDAELMVRVFRLLQPDRSFRAATPESRMEPLVLLADDDPDLIALVDVTLRNDGVTCRAAEDGLVALRLARELNPDLIVLDVRMPKMDGFEVLETLRRDPGLKRLPVILLTGCDDRADVMRASTLLADEYLRKPVSPNILLNRVKRLLSFHGGCAGRWARSCPEKGARGRGVKRWVLNGHSHTGPAESL
jgi:CheY-like chemotaxis protein